MICYNCIIIHNKIRDMIRKTLITFPIDEKDLDLMKGRLIDELPGEIAYIKALLDVQDRLSRSHKPHYHKAQ